MINSGDKISAITRITLDDELRFGVKNAVKMGWAVVLVKPGLKSPACTLPPSKRTDEHFKSGQCGIYHAITDPERAELAVKYAQRQYPDQKLNIGLHAGKSRVAFMDADTLGQVDAFLSDSRWNGDRPSLTVNSPGVQNEDGTWKHRYGGHTYFEVPEGIELPESPGLYAHESAGS